MDNSSREMIRADSAMHRVKEGSSMYGDSTMCALVAPYKVKAGKSEEATQVSEDMRSDIEAMSGAKIVLDVFDDNGVGYSIAVFESPEAKAAASAKIEEIWGRFDGILDYSEEEFGNVEILVG